MKCLAKHPDDRYVNGAELRADLDEVEQKKRPTVTLGTAPMGTRQREAIIDPRTSNRAWYTVAGVLVGLLLLIALVVKLMR